MKTALNPAGLSAGKLTFPEWVALGARHDFDGVEIGLGGAMQWAKENGGGPEAVRALLAENKIAPAVFGLDVEWRKDDAKFNEGIAALPEKAEFAQNIGLTECVTWMPPSVNDDPALWESRIIERFREVARVFNEYNIRFGLEWVGPHHLRAGASNQMGANAWIHTMNGTLDLTEKIGYPNVGLLVDSYHCYTTGVTGADLARLDPSQIVYVHINDASAPAAEARDGNRVLPGTGQIDLTDFLGGLRTGGYTGFVGCEVLAPQPIADDPETAAARVRESLRGVGL